MPHFDAGAVVQTITFRLADSLPREFYEKAAAVASNNRDRFFLLEKAIDQGRGNCVLTDPANAEIVRSAFEHFDGERYRLLAWVVMPNHVHAMIELVPGHPLGDVVHSWKSFSAHAINKARRSNGQVWSHDYFDRFVRDERHYANAKYYIEHNPVKAKLVGKPEDWPFSSATTQE
ncbi:MAG: REP-associated tyrosine transposase [Rhizomicrobium sp.]